MGTTKIKSVQGTGDYKSKFDGSTMYTFEVELEDGVAGEVSAKSLDRWHVGDEVEYKLTQTQYGNRLKLNKPNADFNGGGASYSVSGDEKQRLIMSQWAIGKAMEWEMNQSPPDRTSITSAVAMARLLLTCAKDLENVDIKDLFK